jgi:hypothetical protein
MIPLEDIDTTVLHYSDQNSRNASVVYQILSGDLPELYAFGSHVGITSYTYDLRRTPLSVLHLPSAFTTGHRSMVQRDALYIPHVPFLLLQTQRAPAIPDPIIRGPLRLRNRDNVLIINNSIIPTALSLLQPISRPNSMPAVPGFIPSRPL